MGLGEGRRLSNALFLFFLCVFVLVLVFFADSRWLTLQWNSQWNRKKVGPGGRDEHIIIIIIWISQYLLRTIVIIHHVYVFSCMYPNLFCHVPPLANRLRSPLEARDALRNFRRFGGPAWVRRWRLATVCLWQEKVCVIYIYTYLYIYVCVIYLYYIISYDHYTMSLINFSILLRMFYYDYHVYIYMHIDRYIYSPAHLHLPCTNRLTHYKNWSVKLIIKSHVYVYNK